MSVPEEHRIIIAGFGGQGVLTLGKLLCMSVAAEGSEVTYLPSYGSEVRGGTANCHVVVSNSQIFSPFVETAHSALILNMPSFERFGERIRGGGALVLNTSLVEPGDYEEKHDLTVLGIPATETAAEMGTTLVTNVVMLGAFLRARGLCEPGSVEDSLREFLRGPKSDKIEINLRALARGAELAERQLA